MNNSHLWDHDAYILKDGSCGLIGIDEVGRGSWAGPVVAAAVWFKEIFWHGLDELDLWVDDSKKLTEKERLCIVNRAHVWKEKGWIDVGLGQASAEEIDHLHILEATKKAMGRALKQLNIPPHLAPLPLLEEPIVDLYPRILIDGLPLKAFPWAHQALVKGDQKSAAIALASIIAKVERDRQMVALSLDFPAYGFEQHKGYGTPQHQAAIGVHGLTVQHRRSFNYYH